MSSCFTHTGVWQYSMQSGFQPTSNFLGNWIYTTNLTPKLILFPVKLILHTRKKLARIRNKNEPLTDSGIGDI